MEITDLFKAVRKTKSEYRIKKAKNSTDRDCRRIAILISNEFLAFGCGTNQIPFLEERIYCGLKEMSLRCDSAPDEDRLSEMPKKQLGSFNPLKLWRDKMNIKLEGPNPEYINEILKILAEEVEDGKEKRRIRTDIEHSAISRFF